MQVCNIKESQDSTRNQIEGILKALVAYMCTLSNESTLNSKETLEIRNLFSKCGVIHSAISQKAQEGADAIDKGRNMVGVRV